MSGLVAERRPNKNGVMVTRWVKPAQSEGSGKAMPAPKVAAPSTVKAFTKLDTFLCGYDCDIPPYSDNLRVSVTRMGDYADEFADGVELLFGASDLVIDLAKVAHRIYGDDSTVPEKYRNFVMKNYVSLVPMYSEDDEREDYGVNAAYFAAMTFDAIDGYSATGVYTESQKESYTAAVRYAHTIFPRLTDKGLDIKGFTTVDGRMKFADRDAIDALAEYPLLADIIVTELIKRQTFSGELVRSIAKSGTMRNGIL